jgi:hypothetical protein
VSNLVVQPPAPSKASNDFGDRKDKIKHAGTMIAEKTRNYKCCGKTAQSEKTGANRRWGGNEILSLMNPKTKGGH